MSAVNVESGVCLGFGGTNARRAFCHGGDISGFTSVSTPQNPREFFGWMARQALSAAHEGQQWLVAGYPGPVSADGKMVGPMTNIPGLSSGTFNMTEEIAAADPAAGRLLEEGFMIVNVNDGSLAAQAAARRIGKLSYDRVAALIVGTGVGAGLAESDKAYENVYRIDTKNPLEIGHVPRGANPFDTYENSISGTAIQSRYGTGPSRLPVSHPVWRHVGEGVGQLASMLGVMTGVDLVVPCGGVGSGAAEKYRPHLEAMLEAYSEYGNGPQRQFMPTVLPVPAAECQEFEMFGAEGVMADYYSRAA